jgi:hypothetical protein
VSTPEVLGSALRDDSPHSTVDGDNCAIQTAWGRGSWLDSIKQVGTPRFDGPAPNIGQSAFVSGRERVYGAISLDGSLSFLKYLSTSLVLTLISSPYLNCSTQIRSPIQFTPEHVTTVCVSEYLEAGLVDAYFKLAGGRIRALTAMTSKQNGREISLRLLKLDESL